MPRANPYAGFPESGPVRITRDGEELAVVDTPDDAFAWLIRNQGQSVAYALAWGGYRLATVVPTAPPGADESGDAAGLSEAPGPATVFHVGAPHRATAWGVRCSVCPIAPMLGLTFSGAVSMAEVHNEDHHRRGEVPSMVP